MNEIARLGDMGEGTRLLLFKQDDGDVIVGVIPSGFRFPVHSIEFCVPGSGGGASPKTW